MAVIAFSAYCTTVTHAAAGAGQMALDPAVWQLVVDQDFTAGDNPSLYHAYCAHQGSVNADASGKINVNNYSRDNVYWADGALNLKFEKRSNDSCDKPAITRPYAGAGFNLTIDGARRIAAEFTIKGTRVAGVRPYAALWPAPDMKPQIACAWGGEDDFFEQTGTSFPKIGLTYHYWDDACKHGMRHFDFPVPDLDSRFHTYGAIRDDTIQFFFDGTSVGTAVEQVQPYRMVPHMGVGAYNIDPPDDSRLPAVIQVQRIRVWYKVGQ